MVRTGHYWCVCRYSPSLRDPILEKLGVLAGRLGKNSRQRARINLSLCFPEYSHKERETIIDAMFATAPRLLYLWLN